MDASATLRDVLAVLVYSELPRSSVKPLAYHATMAAKDRISNSASRPTNIDATVEGALAAQEDAMRIARNMLGNTTTVAAAKKHRSLKGHAPLARRLRASARARGAVVHPNRGLPEDIVMVFEFGGQGKAPVEQQKQSRSGNDPLCDADPWAAAARSAHRRSPRDRACMAPGTLHQRRSGGVDIGCGGEAGPPAILPVGLSRGLCGCELGRAHGAGQLAFEPPFVSGLHVGRLDCRGEQLEVAAVLSDNDKKVQCLFIVDSSGSDVELASTSVGTEGHDCDDTAGTETNHRKENYTDAQDILVGLQLARLHATQNDIETRFARLLNRPLVR